MIKNLGLSVTFSRAPLCSLEFPFDCFVQSFRRRVPKFSVELDCNFRANLLGGSVLIFPEVSTIVTGLFIHQNDLSLTLLLVLSEGLHLRDALLLSSPCRATITSSLSFIILSEIGINKE